MRGSTLRPPPSKFDKSFDSCYDYGMVTNCKTCGSTDMAPRSGLCKACRKEYTQAHYQKNKERYIKNAVANNKVRGAANRAWLINYLRTQECVDCGNKDIEVLQFDHRNREEKTKMVYRFLASSLERMIEEVNKCDIRCANCHMKRSRRQMGWWTDEGL
jgi:hypothetical protein